MTSLWPMLSLAMCTAFGGAESWRYLTMKTQCAHKGQIWPDHKLFKVRNHISFTFIHPDIRRSISAVFLVKLTWCFKFHSPWKSKNLPQIYERHSFLLSHVPLGSASLHSVLILHHIDSDVTLIPSSVSSRKQKYTKFKHTINFIRGIDFTDYMRWGGL